MAGFCLLAAAGRLCTAAVPLINPLWLSNTVSCRPSQCRLVHDPLDLLGPVAAVEARRKPGAAERLAARSREPGVRRMLFASKLVSGVPEALMYLSLALALGRFGRSDPFSPSAVRWLRRAALAAAAAVLAQPIATTLRNTALQPAVTGKDGVVFALAGNQLVAGLFLAGVVWVVAWAFEEGRRARDELAQYV